MERICRNCRWWDMHSTDMVKGDCRKKVDGVPHRYWRTEFAGGTVALLDSFGPEETKPTYSCGAFEADAALDELRKPVDEVRE